MGMLAAPPISVEDMSNDVGLSVWRLDECELTSTTQDGVR